MASSATHGDAIAALEEIKAPPGVVLPPREIKGMFSPRTPGGTPILTFGSYSREDSRLCSAEWYRV
jgi:hypothetical protein